MKKSFIVLLSVLFFTFSAFANEITEDVAIRKASELMSNRQNNFTGKVNTTDLVKISGEKVYYIINFEPEGWVLISAQDVTKPVIGYSSTGFYVNQNQPESMRSWFQQIEDEIIRAAKTTSKKTSGMGNH